MGTNTVIGIIIALVSVAGGYFVFMAANDAAVGDAMVGAESSQKNTSEAMMDDEVEEHDGAMAEGDEVMTTDEKMMDGEPGTYEVYDPAKLARADEGTVVLFFHATWCPTCRAFKSDVSNNLADIPAGLTILEVNYDTETALKQKYGITYQHTYVEVDSEGNARSKWSGSPTLEAFLREV